MRESLLSALAPFHLVGGGGVGMSGLARVLLEKGWSVSVSDRSDSETLESLRLAGAAVFVGHEASSVPDHGTLIVSSAIRDDNPEVIAAERNGLAVLHRAQVLALVAGGSPTIAVTGTHGKSTTTAMIAHILVVLGEDPTALVGADILAWGSNARVGAGHTVIEADESDGSLCWLTSDIAVVTNIEADHLDHYRDIDEITATMAAFVRQIKPGGYLIAGTDDPGVRRMLEVSKVPNLLTFGEDSDLQISNGGGLVMRGEALPLELTLPGRHNLLNAAAAILACVAAGIEASSAASALSSFQSIARRFEVRGTVRGIRVVDDYAHHPTEVRAVLAAARSCVDEGGRVIAIFEPHLFSRTRDFGLELGWALAEGADLVAVLPIYAAREDPLDGVSSTLVVQAATGSIQVDGYEAAVAWAQEVARPGDLVMTLGAGPITTLAPALLTALEGGSP